MSGTHAVYTEAHSTDHWNYTTRHLNEFQFVQNIIIYDRQTHGKNQTNAGWFHCQLSRLQHRRRHPRGCLLSSSPQCPKHLPMTSFAFLMSCRRGQEWGFEHQRLVGVALAQNETDVMKAAGACSLNFSQPVLKFGDLFLHLRLDLGCSPTLQFLCGHRSRRGRHDTGGILNFILRISVCQLLMKRHAPSVVGPGAHPTTLKCKQSTPPRWSSMLHSWIAKNKTYLLLCGCHGSKSLPLDVCAHDRNCDRWHTCQEEMPHVPDRAETFTRSLAEQLPERIERHTARCLREGASGRRHSVRMTDWHPASLRCRPRITSPASTSATRGCAPVRDQKKTMYAGRCQPQPRAPASSPPPHSS